jgi:hypothetical protein
VTVNANWSVPSATARAAAKKNPLNNAHFGILLRDTLIEEEPMSEFRLSDAQEVQLARLAASCGRSQAEILDEALDAVARARERHDQWITAQATALTAIWDNDYDAVYDRL